MRWPVCPLPLLAVGALAAGCATPADRVAAGPQRPTVSSDTSTTAPDSLEVELGASWDPSERFEVPTTWKYGAGEKSELFLDVPLYQRMDRSGVRDGDDLVGDVLLGLRRRFYEDEHERFAAAWQLGVKLPTGDERAGLSSGETDLALAGILDAAAPPAGFTAFCELSVQDPTDAADLLTTVALAAGVHTSEEQLLFLELADFWGELGDAHFLLTGGVARWLRKDLVIDAAVVLGSGADTPELQLVAGLTANLGAVVRRGPAATPALHGP